MARIIAASAVATLCSAASPWPAALKAQAAQIAQSMTLAEQLSMLYGLGVHWSTENTTYVGVTNGVARVGVQPFHEEDGPQGVADRLVDVTMFPSALTVTQTWDASMMYAFGAAMGREQFLKGSNVMLGPGMNIARVPWGGRTFEYLGEDPHLASAMAAAVIHGIQSQNVSACAKHYVQNDQEYNRNTVSANIGQRAHMELYMPPFAASVDAGVGSFMCSYNRINGTYACENPVTLTDELRTLLGFEGFVMSDWTGTHSTTPAAVAGLDQEQPGAADGSSYFGTALANAVAAGNVSAARITEMVTRAVLAQLATGGFANPDTPDRNVTSVATSPASIATAQQLAMASITLLKNDDNLLPLSLGSFKTIAVIGDNYTVGGTGSGKVIPTFVMAPADAIAAVVGPGVSVVYNDGSDPVKAAAVAAAADVAIVVVATFAGEGSDRVNMSLPQAQDAYTSAVAAAQSKTVVVARCPGACIMPWSSAVPSILYELMPGQESATSIAATLFGMNNPSGKLPVSFPNDMGDTWLGNPVNPMQYPGTDRGNGYLEADYSENLLVGYRWYDAQGTSPAWPFGHGLSYTTFTYASLVVTGSVSPTTSATVTMQLSNSGLLPGAEVVQLYLAHPAAAGEPPKQLRGFQKQGLTSGGSAALTFQLTWNDAAIWDVVSGGWVVVPGTYGVLVGSSSADIRLSGSVVVSA